MLTSDLVRVWVRKGRVEPMYLDTLSADALERAAALIELFEEGLGAGWERGRLDESVEEKVGHGTDFLLWRGLAKLLYDRSEFEVRAVCDPAELRRAVFERAAAMNYQFLGSESEARTAVLEAVAGELGVDAGGIAGSLYADLEARQVMVAFKSLTPSALLERYNVALAQAVLFRATRLVITLEAVDSNRLRYLFSAMKFHGLMHSARRTTKKKTLGSYEVVIDGPASLFKQNRKYGLQMATFLPALLNLEGWQLRAELQEDPKNRGVELLLSSETGLKSHYKMRGQWVSKEEKRFEERFATVETDWKLKRQGTALDLTDNEVIVADYVLTSPEGQQVYVEIVGFWRLAYLERRLAMLKSLKKPLVLVVSERLKADREAFKGGGPQVVFFKGVILVDKVLEAAERALGGATDQDGRRP